MKILVSNDDGIQAEGLRSLVAALLPYAEVYVYAPMVQQSAASQKVNIRERIYVEERQMEGVARACAVGGTPADCVKIGLVLLGREGVHIDAVFSGINHGSNLGRDVFYSGTLGAAREGVFGHKPAIAVSVASHNPKNGFDYACELAVMALKDILPKIDENTIININVPDVPREEIAGIRITRQGPKDYIYDFPEALDDDGSTYYLYSGKAVVYEGLPEDLDSVAAQDNYATITPLSSDCTDYALFEEMKTWDITK